MLEHALIYLKSGTPPMYVVILGVVAYAHLDWWLSRTSKVKANNGLEALGNGLKKILVHKIPIIGKFLTAMASKDEAPPAQDPPK